MKRVFRTALLVALLATVAAALVPFSQAIDASFQLDNPPLWVPVSALLSLVGLPTALIALVGLYRFKSWARPLGVFVGALFIVGLTVLGVSSPVLQALAPLALALLALALIAWLVSLVLAYGKDLSGHFGS
jgi:O-antigen/teichoic acid export membrane protein